MTLFTKTIRRWASFSLRTKGIAIVLLPVAALLLSIVLIDQAEKKKVESEGWVKHTQDVRIEILNTYIVLISAESSVRDYALTGHETALQAYDRAGASIDVVLDRIKELVQDNPEQVQRLARLKDLAHRRVEGLKVLRGYYDSPQSRGKEAPQELVRQGKAAMDQALLELTRLFTTENRLLKERTKKSQETETILDVVIIGCVIVGLLGGILAVWIFTRGIGRRVQQAEEIAHRLEQGLPVVGSSSANDEIGRLASALERAGAILSKQAEELKLALDSAKVLIWELEPEGGRIRYQAGSDVLKTAKFPSELLPETTSGWLAVVHADDRDFVRTQLDRVLADGSSLQIEYRVVIGGGDIRWMAAKAQLHSEDNGRPRRLLGVIMDVTERKKAAEEIVRREQELAVSREALQQQTRILRSILDSMGDGVVVADRQGQFLVFNPAAEQVLGVRAFAGEPHKWSEHYGLFLPDTLALYPTDQLPFSRAIRGEFVDGAEMLIRPAGSNEGSWISVNARPLRESDGGINGAVMVMRDITASKCAAEAFKLAKQEAERANQAKSEFLSRMSHELRTPLNSILGFAQLLHMAQLSGRPLECVEYILKSGKHLLGLIDEVLDISRIEAGRLALSPEPVLLSEAIHQAVDMVRPIADQFSVELLNRISPACQQHVTADRQRLQQVVLNVLSNAIKYNRPRGTVTVSSEIGQFGRVRLKVTDTGIGIAPEDQHRLFVPFERLSAGKTDVQGTGLGLALSKRLIESMDGSMGVESQLGSGSTFWVELPGVEAPTERIDREGTMANELVQPLDRSRTVLYVEDNMSNVRLMEHVLSYRPHVRLLTAMQGQMGIDLALEHIPDLIFLDLHLPDLTGDKVLLQLRSDQRTRNIPMVMISADATPGQISRLLEAGATDYLTKPLDVKKLLQILDESLNGSPATTGLGTVQSSNGMEVLR
jgi:signal transduction histidine kinase/CHASE3 domain sensor protein/ActR/RegA family two-component response regulator